MMVVDLYRIGQGHRLAIGEVIEIAVRRRERPALGTLHAIGGIGDGPSDSQLSWTVPLARPVITPEALTPVISTAWVSVRSASTNVIVPLAVSSVAASWVSARSVRVADLRSAGDYRRIVGAGDGDGERLGDDAAMAVVDGRGVGQRQDFAVRQEVERAVGDAVAPARRTIIGIAGACTTVSGASTAASPQVVSPSAAVTSTLWR